MALDEQVLKRRKRGFAGDINMAGVQIPPRTTKFSTSERPTSDVANSM